jgi:7,8-dihydropterin-6-yl-methyl-4-(beta-D-ribofuranosyl)aminobenzene 5'-phosphate synthase
MMRTVRLQRLFAAAACAFMLSGCAPAGSSSPTGASAAPTNTAPPPERSAIGTEFGALKITILSDNIPGDKRLTTDWGFAALIERGDTVILFDTGADGAVLLGNMKALGIDPGRIQKVVISHAHDDHTGGLADFLAASSHPPVYLLAEFGNAFIESVKAQTDVVETAPGMEIADGILTTGHVGGRIPEQALAIRTAEGLVVITGCAHPGIVEIVSKVKHMTMEPVYLVMGGFHLLEKSAAELTAVIQDLRRQGVKAVAPSHCTGEHAITEFAAEFGADFHPVGAGAVIEVPVGTRG